jgi:hypothetical protein
MKQEIPIMGLMEIVMNLKNLSIRSAPTQMINATTTRDNMSPTPTRYTPSAWQDLLNDTIAEIQKLSKLKGGEYAGDDDRLANFRRNAANFGVNMDTIWSVYAAKHWDALMQYIKDINQGTVRDRLEPIAGRVDDLLVYLLLYKAILDERGEVTLGE